MMIRPRHVITRTSRLRSIRRPVFVPEVGQSRITSSVLSETKIYQKKLRSNTVHVTFAWIKLRQNMYVYATVCNNEVDGKFEHRSTL